MNQIPVHETPPSKPRRAGLAAALAAAALVGAGGSAVGVAALGSDSSSTREVTVQSAVPAASSSTTVGSIYTSASKAVVEITVTSAGDSGQFGGTQNRQAQGSGFVYDEQGRIITNQHVVDGATSVSVKFPNGATYDATVVGSDPSTDVAVIDVDAPASLLEPLQLGDSSQVQVGDGVIAIGSPFGLDLTVTAGIVSALHREITSPNNFAIDDAIQTDAAINHGNSGGPLLDMSGDVIGVNSQIESDSGGNDGVGFAVPSNTVETIANQLISTGKVEHAYLGVSVTEIPASAAEQLGLAAGVEVTTVRTGTPAADAGLVAGSGTKTVDGQPYPTGGDVITKVGETEVSTGDQLRSAVDALTPGDSVDLTIVRNGETKTVPVTLGIRPAA